VGTGVGGGVGGVGVGPGGKVGPGVGSCIGSGDAAAGPTCSAPPIAITDVASTNQLAITLRRDLEL